MNSNKVQLYSANVLYAAKIFNFSLILCNKCKMKIKLHKNAQKCKQYTNSDVQH